MVSLRKPEAPSAQSESFLQPTAIGALVTCSLIRWAKDDIIALLFETVPSAKSQKYQHNLSNKHGSVDLDVML
ncbi:hypothetical protein KL86PLE_40731 [uncultured Pleomorphomonas sp.]|uniref:Uncharacterized protein n=1 Tax=uncultured Pleomorphomonas sp. TaxID=442121 RepID=A0A212LH90_9HYPH|nr:hypothetical protein KL86PLE_40731 [uncultured Pleomorphomonas sp.]